MSAETYVTADNLSRYTTKAKQYFASKTPIVIPVNNTTINITNAVGITVSNIDIQEGDSLSTNQLYIVYDNS